MTDSDSVNLVGNGEYEIHIYTPVNDYLGIDNVPNDYETFEVGSRVRKHSKALLLIIKYLQELYREFEKV